MNKLFTKIAGLTLGLSLAIGGGAFLAKSASKDVRADYAFMTFDFEDDGAHRPDSTNSYSENTYAENSANINLVYGDSVITGTPLSGSANVILRVAKKTTNSPSMVIGPVDLSTYNISGITYNTKSISSLTVASSYSTDGTNWTSLESHSGNSTAADKGSATGLSISEPSSFYFKVAVTVTSGSSTSSNRDTQIDDVKFIGSSTSSKPLDSISCSDQELEVTKSVDLASKITYSPTDAANKEVSFAIKSGSDYIDLTEAGVVTAKKSGSAVITITPEDTSGSATPIDVNISTTAITVPGITVGNQYVVYAVDATNGNYELTGLASSLGTAKKFDGDIPSCEYVLDTEVGYYENTVAFKNGTKYFALTSAANNIHQETSVTANSSWIVSYDSSDNSAVLTNAVYQSRTIQFNYNSGNARFACYNAGGQVAISLYPYVEKSLTNFTIDSSIEVYKSGTATIGVTYDPVDASDKDLTWVSNDETIATVDENGVVTGVAIGETTITASKMINSVLVERTCAVTVLSNSSVHKGNLSNPFDVNDAIQVAKGVFVKDCDGEDISLENEYYVTGIITNTVNRTTTTLTFWIGDDASQTSAAAGGFEIYKAAKVYGEALATRYSTNDEVVADFNVGDTVIVKSTFMFYDEKTTAETVQNVADIVYSSHIDSESYSEGAIAFAESLLGYTCDATGNTAPSSEGWGTLQTTYLSDSLTPEDRAKFASEEASDIKSPVSDIQKVKAAMAKYDYVVAKYNKGQGLTTEYPDFIERDPAALRNVTPTVASESSNSAITIVVVIAITSVTSIGVLLVLKRRKSY